MMCLLKMTPKKGTAAFRRRKAFFICKFCCRTDQWSPVIVWSLGQTLSWLQLHHQLSVQLQMIQAATYSTLQHPCYEVCGNLHQVYGFTTWISVY